MSNLGPGEVLEHFAGDLSTAIDQVAKTEMIHMGAAQAANTAAEFSADTEMIAKTAGSELSALRTTVISAIESAGEDIDGRDVLEATMSAKGRSEQEIEDYFSHIDRIEEDKQPIVIICAAEAQVGIGS